MFVTIKEYIFIHFNEFIQYTGLFKYRTMNNFNLLLTNHGSAITNTGRPGKEIQECFSQSDACIQTRNQRGILWKMMPIFVLMKI